MVKHMRILIFEPNLDTNKIIKGLSNFKHHFFTASDMVPAIAVLNQHRIDMIIMSSHLEEAECRLFYEFVRAYGNQLTFVRLIDDTFSPPNYTAQTSVQVLAA